MAKQTRATIARKAYAKAEADFATWLMMAKLGGFDDLPADAQSFLMSYRTRLETMPEAEATAATVRTEVYVAYYADMGGEGAAPEPGPVVSTAGNNVVDLKSARRAQTARVAERAKTEAPPTRALRPFLIFAGMVAVLAAFKFAFGF